MDTYPNIILIMTDQQRADTIRALGAPWMHTPTLDRLTREGTAFTQCFVTSPVCVASRASLFSGTYPHARAIYKNFEPWEPVWVKWLSDAGYHCVNIGKMHINPYDALGGFHQRLVVENKDRPLFLDEHDRAFYDEWDKALRAHKVEKPSRYSRFRNDPEGYRSAMGAFTWEFDESLHSDVFIGDTVVWWLRERQATSPLFLQIGFPGPHPPYDPVKRYLDWYSDVAIPVPDVRASELDAQPNAQRILRDNMIKGNYDSVAWRTLPDKDDLLRVRKHYFANVTMIDEQVGRIFAELEAGGYLDNALVIFTSDHGDALGDHGHIQKWTMYDTVERVPLIVWSRGHGVQGRICDDFVQLPDVAPTVLEAAGLTVPDHWEARSLWPLLSKDEDGYGRDVVYAELSRDHIQTGAEYMIMRRDREWKLVYYLGEEDGELYDLSNDPQEVSNLWGSKAYSAKRKELVYETLDWYMRQSIRSRVHFGRKHQTPMLL